MGVFRRTPGDCWTSLDPPSRSIVALLGAACVGATLIWLPVTPRAAIAGLALAPLWWAAAIDLAERRLPNRLVLAGAAVVLGGVLIVAAADGANGGWRVGQSTVSGAAAMVAPMLAIHLIAPDGLGFGDVKAGAVLGAIVGLIDAWAAAVALATGAIMAAVAGLVLRRRTVPFGPALVAGVAVALVVARALGVRPVR